MAGRSILGVVCIALVATSCLPEDEDGSEGNIIDAQAQLDSVSEVVWPGGNTHLVSSCVAQAEFGAFAGDGYWTEEWNAAGASQEGMRTRCEGYDDGTLADLHNDWVAFEAFVAANEAERGGDPPADAAPSVAEPPSECDPNYDGACVPLGALNLNCDDLPDLGIHSSFQSVGSDPHGFDADSNGSACVSLGS